MRQQAGTELAQRAAKTAAASAPTMAWRRPSKNWLPPVPISKQHRQGHQQERRAEAQRRDQPLARSRVSVASTSAPGHPGGPAQGNGRRDENARLEGGVIRSSAARRPVPRGGRGPALAAGRTPTMAQQDRALDSITSAKLSSMLIDPTTRLNPVP